MHSYFGIYIALLLRDLDFSLRIYFINNSRFSPYECVHFRSNNYNHIFCIPEWAFCQYFGSIIFADMQVSKSINKLTRLFQYSVVKVGKFVDSG